MRFYTKTHTHYCGIDLHAKTMYLCILDREGQILLPGAHDPLRDPRHRPLREGPRLSVVLAARKV